MNPDLLSIIIPTYNRANLLGETLDSIKAQSYTNWECLIVDDGSTDATNTLVSKYTSADDRFKYLKRPDSLPKGSNSCRNYGFEQSKGAYVNWFDSDDTMDVSHYQQKIDKLKTNSRAHCSIGLLQFFEEINGQKKFSEVRNINTTNPVEDYILGKISIGTTNPVWRREIITAQPSLFDPEITQSQDLELYSRIFKEYNEIEIINQPLIFVRRTGSTISNKLLSADHRAMDSYVKVRHRILELDYGNDVNQGLLQQLLYIFRLALDKKDYVICDRIMQIIKGHKKSGTLSIGSKLFRMDLSYEMVRNLGFGATRLKSLFRL